MTATELAGHFVAVMHGIGAAVSCAVVLYLAGLVLTPVRFRSRLMDGATPGFLGASAFVVLCWFGVAWYVPVSTLAAGFTAAVLLLAWVRRRQIGPALRVTPTTRWAIGAFAVLYLLMYVFTIPPLPGEYLPPAWTGNVDLLTYARYTKHVLRADTLRGVDRLDPAYMHYVYLQTPAVFYLTAALSAFFGFEPLRALMPMGFACGALIGMMVALIARSVFRLPRGLGLAVGAVLLSGPFFRYVFGAYYLSTLVSLPAVLYLVWVTARHSTRNAIDWAAAIQYLAAYLLLLLTYPLLLGVGIAAQVGLLMCRALAEARAAEDWRGGVRLVRPALTWRLATLAVPLILLVGLFWNRVIWSIDEARMLSRPGVAGWPLELISPLAILGLPGTTSTLDACWLCVPILLTSASARVWGLTGFAVLALGVALLYFVRLRTRATPAQQALTAVAAAALLGYCAYYILVGPSYQQWKFASYTALPWSAVLLAAVAAWLQHPGTFAGGNVPRRRRRRVGVIAACLLVLIVGNRAAEAVAGSPLLHLRATLANIARLDRLPGFREIVVRMEDTPGAFATYLAIYFMPSKRVHVVATHFRPNEPLSYERVAPERPLLLQGFSCEGVGHAEVLDVEGVGCLLYQPPSPSPETVYPFNRTFLFIELGNFGPRQTEGRWNARSRVWMKLYADLRRMPVDSDEFLVLKLTPYLPPGVERQRVQFSIDDEQRGEVVLRAPGEVSVPTRLSDWRGERVRTLTLAIDLPDAVEPPWMYAPTGRVGTAPLAVLFEEASLRRAPVGSLANAGENSQPSTSASHQQRRPESAPGQDRR